MPARYKFVEVSPVTAETLEAAVNEWVAKGWELEGIRFVGAEHSQRPHLAFVSFVVIEEEAPPHGPRPFPPPDEQASAASVITAPHGTDVD